MCRAQDDSGSRWRDSCRVGCGRDSLFLAPNLRAGWGYCSRWGAETSPNWKDMAAAVRLCRTTCSGSGKTAVKASLGRYMAYEGTHRHSEGEQSSRDASPEVARRSWRRRGTENWFPDCDLTNPFAQRRVWERSTTLQPRLRPCQAPTSTQKMCCFDDRRGNWQASRLRSSTS